MPEVERYFLENEDILRGLIGRHLQQSGRYSAELAEWQQSDDGSGDPPEKLADEAQKFWEEAEALLEGSDRSFLDEQLALAVRMTMEEVSVVDRYELGGFDLLWILLAVGTAWRLGRGKTTPQPVPARRRSSSRGGSRIPPADGDPDDLRDPPESNNP